MSSHTTSNEGLYCPHHAATVRSHVTAIVPLEADVCQPACVCLCPSLSVMSSDERLCKDWASETA